MLLKKALFVQVVMLVLGGPEMLIFAKFVIIFHRLQIAWLVRRATAQQVSEDYLNYKTSFYNRHPTVSSRLEKIIVEDLEC